MDKHIIDGMKKEGKKSKYLMIVGYLLAILTPLVITFTQNTKYSKTDIILICVFCFAFGTLGLYIWLYTIKYHLEITESKIMLKTLFRNLEINIRDITNYTYDIYGKSVFYQFRLSVKGKEFLLNTPRACRPSDKVPSGNVRTCRR